MDAVSVARVFRTKRTVRLSDAGPDGRLRFDSVARFLGDVAEQDVEDAGLRDGTGWLVRRTSWDVIGLPRLGAEVELATWCSGVGPRWAERTTTVGGPDGDLLRTVTLWVAVGRDGRPRRLSAQFLDLYGRSAGDRRVSARLSHPPPPMGTRSRPWPLRRTDIDVFGHVNNAVHWAAVVDELATSDRGPAHAGRPLSVAELEYREPVEPGTDVELCRAEGDPATGTPLRLWFQRQGRVLASATLLFGGTD